MPVNPTIALAARPPQAPDVLANFGRLRALANTAQQLQLGQEELKGAELQNQLRQTALDDEAKMRTSWAEADGDPEQMLTIAAQKGVSSDRLLATRTALTKAAEARASLDKTQREALMAKNDLLHGLLQPVLGEQDPVKQQQLWDRQMEAAVGQGLVTPEEAAKHAYPGAAGVKQYADSLTTDKWLNAQAAQIRAKAAETQAQAAFTNASTGAAREKREGDLATRASEKQAFEAAVSDLGANPPASAADYRARVGKLPPAIAGRILQAIPAESYNPATSPVAIRRLVMSGEQQTQAVQTAATAAETARHNEATEKTQAAGQTEARRHNLIVEGQQAGVAEAEAARVPDATSQSILAQTGLSMLAFDYLTKGTPALSRLPGAQRFKVIREAENWSNSRGVDVSTFRSRFKALNDVLERNIARMNNTQVAEGEISGTIENLMQAANEAGFGSARAYNAARRWIAGEFNDADVQKYGVHLNQLQSELAYYNAATQGRNTTEIRDMDEAAKILKNGIAAGSLVGMKEAIARSVEKMGVVMEQSVDRAQRGVWDLFGVGANYPGNAGGGRGGAGAGGGGRGGRGGEGGPGGAGQALVIEVNGKRYQYKGSGSTADLKNYTEVRR